MNPDHDLDAQQHHLTKQQYDLRISNLARFILKKISDVQSKRRLLDVGAGNGLFLKFFKSEGFDVSGYELEHALVDKMHTDAELKGVSIAQADITRLEGKPLYDVVIASDVIEHIQEHEKAVQNLWKFVAPGGRLVITVPAHMHLYGKRDIAWGHFRRYDKQMLQSVVSRLEKANVETMTFWNFPGYFIYFFFEKILQKQVNETVRYSNSLASRIIRSFFQTELKMEESVGGLPWGLTLVAVVRKVS